MSDLPDYCLLEDNLELAENLLIGLCKAISDEIHPESLSDEEKKKMTNLIIFYELATNIYKGRFR